jgi:hypothetical protein
MAKAVIEACNIKGNIKEVQNLWNKFNTDAYIKKNMNEENRKEAFVTMIESELDMGLEDINYFDVSAGQFRGVKNKINKMSKAIRKGTMAGGLAEMMYTSSAIASKNPQIKGMLEEFIHISHHLKGRQQKHGRMYNNLIGFLRKEAISRGYEKESIIAGTASSLMGKTVKAKADKLENDITKAYADYKNKKPGAAQKLEALKASEDRFYQQEEGRIFEELRYHIEESIPKMYNKLAKDGVKNPKIDDYIKDFTYIDPVTGVEKPITNKGMQQAVKEHMNVIDETFTTLNNGVNKFIESITIGLKNTTSTDRIKAIEKKLKDRLSPNEIRGYYPHYSRDINDRFIQGLMPHLEQTTQSTSLTLSGHSKKDADNALKGLEDYISNVDEGYLSGHAKSRSESDTYSKNYLTVMKNYIDEIDRFNFIAHSNKTAREAIMKAKDLWASGQDMKGYGTSVVKYMRDLHAAQTGVGAITNPKIDTAMRTILGMEFTSKLGFNLRSALRNSTQGLLNYVQFGFLANKKADSYIDRLPLDVDTKWGSLTQMNKDMDKAGFLFEDTAPQLEETLGLKGGMHKVLRLNENTGNVEFTPIGKMEKVSAGVSTAAAKAGVAMQKVENWNRKRTYKTAFATMHAKLTDNQEYVNALMDGSYDGTKRTSEQAESYLWNKARKYGINMVNMLHFDYSDVSKAKALRTPLGKIIGQFQHYGFKFWELNSGIFKGAKNDIISGNMSGADALKAYRMSMIYFLAPVLAAGLTGLDFSNLVEHDSKQRIAQLAAVLSGDEDRIEEVTYGRGITTMVGGPLVSDMLEMGNIMGFVDLDDNELNNFLVGYQRQADMDGDDRSMRIQRLFSTALSRNYNSTLPMAMSGNIGFALQLESGLLKTKEARDTQKKLQASLPAVLSTKDKDVLKSLDLLQGTSKKKVPHIY